MKHSIKHSWEKMDLNRKSLLNRYEDYAKWTLPSIFPEQTSNANREQSQTPDSTGARAVNNLANKVAMTLFPPHSPFFRLNVESDLVSELNASALQGDQDAKEMLAIIDSQLAAGEKAAMKLLNYNRFRTEIVNVSKALIVTGNSLLYSPFDDGAKAQTYSIRDYVVKRDIAGNVLEIITKDQKAFSTFSEDVQKQIRSNNRNKQYKDDSNVELYTKIELKSDGKYHMIQDADEARLDSKATWVQEDFPYIVLTWNLQRGEDYGRGLVEDYAGAFHALSVLHTSLVDLVGIAADIKFLVRPSSLVDVKALNDSESGSYHTGEEGDITTANINKIQDMQFILELIEMYKKEIGQAFLLNSSVQRDAERVTAEEIRYVARELEISHGGIYSRFAEEWQLRLAMLLMRKLDFSVSNNDKTVYPQIITGLDSLSRAGDLDNLRLFISDLQLLEAVPEDIRSGIDRERYIEYVGVRRGIEYSKFTKSAEQLMQESQMQEQLQERQLQMQVEANVAEEAGKVEVNNQ